MTPKPGPPKEFPRDVYARISDEHYEHLAANFDSISEGIRAAIQCLIDRPPGRPPSPDSPQDAG